MSMNNKICPLMSKANYIVYCKKERCAWYTYLKQCSLSTIALNIRSLEWHIVGED